MTNNPWRSELFRFFFFLIIIAFLYQVSGSLLLAVVLGLMSYIAVILFKLFEIFQWLVGGVRPDKTPEGTGVFGGIISLIYRHKKAIEESNQQEKAITRQFHETISAIPSATIVLNEHNEIEWANYASLVLLGINGQRDVGIRIDHLLRHHELIKRLYKNNTEQFEMLSPVSSDITLAVQLVDYAGKKCLLIAHNISPHIDVQRSRKTFVANASHELRTPLTVISGYLDFIHTTPQLPESLQKPVEKAIEQSNNMQGLISDLLALSKLEDKHLKEKHLSIISLKKHLHEMVLTLQASGKIPQNRLKTYVDKGLKIQAAEKELNSICLNLISNAIKYSEPGSEINISWRQAGDNAVFTVTDEGIGIAPEHIHYLTERFYRVDSGRSRRVGGTGLGLSIVKHIVERHNGRMEIHSRLGEGSVFSVILPIVQKISRDTAT